jgi:2-phospho-L-lactate transferase/gluconeogenesis factor (CofD/UPF0052 family)
MSCAFINTILVNNEEIPPDIQERYSEEMSKPVVYDTAALTELGLEIMHGEIVSHENGIIRHDTKEVAQMLYNLLLDETNQRFNA